MPKIPEGSVKFWTCETREGDPLEKAEKKQLSFKFNAALMGAAFDLGCFENSG